MAGFTTRELKGKALTPETHDPQRVLNAAAHIADARRDLLRAARELDTSPTREQHKDAQELLDKADTLQVRLTEWGVEVE